MHFYRHSGAPSVRPLPGPLRILIAIASPLTGGGQLLDYERELRAVIEAVGQARTYDAQVKEVRFATIGAIAAGLRDHLPHVLHVHAHGSPGLLHLEDDAGDAVAVTSSVFLQACAAEAPLPPIISLASCQGDVFSEPFGSSFASALSSGGVPAVVATQGTLSDRFSTHFFAQVYAELAKASHPDLVAAIAVARRSVQETLQAATNPVDRVVAGLDEWSVVSLLCGEPVVAPLSEGASTTAPGSRVYGTDQTNDRFVGRRWELRKIPGLLAGDGSDEADIAPAANGILLYGLGGLGKSALAAALVDRATELRAGLRTVILSGCVDSGSVITAVAGAGQTESANRAPTLLILDDFDENLRSDPLDTLPDGTSVPLLWRIADPSLDDLLVQPRKSS
ncbi:CHAT domain-containing protein [Micromonospora sp. Llam0]|uniref:CHAT domain-containing protein n=1 Tax=Micromonospora sp. Llam0 TaxID=2485143 RepID=UPI000F98F5F2|nr:CHAT domain-containing protein [Micromonospora sp. Llam0]ROO59052.1 CHAT domain-containing protein [Micromonospora sp. Llam0]